MDGAHPQGGLVQADGGHLYGMTPDGGVRLHVKGGASLYRVELVNRANHVRVVFEARKGGLLLRLSSDCRNPSLTRSVTDI